MSLTYDQIKEVAELFPRAKYIAMDENGEAWTYSVKPVCHYGWVVWDASSPDFDMRYVRELNYYHHPREDWRDSLINIEQVLASGLPPSATNPTPICQEPFQCVIGENCLHYDPNPPLPPNAQSGVGKRQVEETIEQLADLPKGFIANHAHSQTPAPETPAQYNTAREYSPNNIITISHTIQWNSQTGAIKLSPTADWITPSNSDTQD